MEPFTGKARQLRVIRKLLFDATYRVHSPSNSSKKVLHRQRYQPDIGANLMYVNRQLMNMFKLFIFFFLVQLEMSVPVRCIASDKVNGILEAHNAVRETLGIEKLVWSNEIARYAQEWADYLAQKNKCGMQHRSQTGKDIKPYGENIYQASGIQWSDGNIDVQQINAADVVNSWVSESTSYDHSSNTCTPGKSCGHYTQVVWRKSKKLGCGMAFCADKSQVWVCNYTPPGNIAGQKPY